MKNNFNSLQFSGLRKWLFYTTVGLNFMIILLVLFLLGFQLVTENHITGENYAFELSSTKDTIVENIFEKPYGEHSFASFIVTMSGSSFLLSAFLWIIAFTKWREFIKGNEYKKKIVAESFTTVLFIEFFNVLSWPSQVDILNYSIGILTLAIAMIICFPIVKDLYIFIINDK